MLTVATLTAGACGGRSQTDPGSGAGTAAPATGQPATRPTAPASLETRLEDARLALRKGERETAWRLASELTREFHSSAEAWLVAASAALALGKADDALGAVNVAVELKPAGADGWATKGAAHRALGQPVEAEKAFQRALQLDPTSRAARTNLAVMRGLAGDWAGQATMFEVLLKDAPDDPEARLGLAEAYLRLGDLARAEAEVKTLVERTPANLAGQRLAAAIAWQREDYRLAFERAKIALKLDAKDALAHTYFEAGFYIVVGARLTCLSGKRPWPETKIAEVLTKLAEEEDLTGVETFVTLDTQYANNADVQGRVARAAGDCKQVP